MAASRLPLALLLACSSWLLACSVGEGEGWVRSDRLVIEDCWDGPFDLQPTFFGANPHREEEIRFASSAATTSRSSRTGSPCS